MDLEFAQTGKLGKIQMAKPEQPGGSMIFFAILWVLFAIRVHIKYRLDWFATFVSCANSLTFSYVHAFGVG